MVSVLARYGWYVPGLGELRLNAQQSGHLQDYKHDAYVLKLRKGENNVKIQARRASEWVCQRAK